MIILTIRFELREIFREILSIMKIDSVTNLLYTMPIANGSQRVKRKFDETKFSEF